MRIISIFTVVLFWLLSTVSLFSPYNVCTKAENSGTKVKPHDCGKNWSGSSQAMEAAVFLDGFSECLSCHWQIIHQLMNHSCSQITELIFLLRLPIKLWSIKLMNTLEFVKIKTFSNRICTQTFVYLRYLLYSTQIRFYKFRFLCTYIL